MKLFPRCDFEIIHELPKAQLATGLSKSLTFTDNQFTGDLVDNLRLKGNTLISGRVEDNVVKFSIQASREFSLSTGVWLIIFALVLTIGIAHEIRNAYFNLWTIGLVGIGFSVYVLSLVVYRISVRVQHQNMQRLIDKITFGE